MPLRSRHVGPGTRWKCSMTALSCTLIENHFFFRLLFGVGRPFSFELLEKATDCGSRRAGRAREILLHWRFRSQVGSFRCSFRHVSVTVLLISLVSIFDNHRVSD